ncbi:MAG TPA: hemolysin III family protein [Alphaproteobacteria bacterium]|jgi:hemolysin III|nr:hemolysin III family protein [Alphaproteobacteria bacterium]
MLSTLQSFPDYTAAEKWADGVVHVAGLVASPLAIAWLFLHAGPEITTGRIVTGTVYAAGLLGMLWASALYNLVRAGPLKSILRRVDHAMIFVMIAGTFTPLGLIAMPEDIAIPLCIAVWLLAAMGSALKLMNQNWAERISVFLYLALSWTALLPLVGTLPTSAIALMLIGGVLYSLGSFIHSRAAWPFHNAVWHALVLAAAGAHLTAIAEVMALPVVG